MKIDLHTHTKKCKQGDGSLRNIRPNDFISAMRKNDVGICAITNHNHFDLEGYEDVIKEDPDLVVLPGIELDVLFDDNHYHIIVICDPEKRGDFSKVFDNDPSRNYELFNLAYDEFIDKVRQFSNEDIVIIPHFLDKDKKRSLNVESKKKLQEDLTEYLIILEPRGLQTMGVINAHNELSLIGSDVKDWSKYDQAELPEIKFKINTFKRFYELAKNPAHFIENYLGETEKYPIEIDMNGKKTNNNVEVFRDINIIFGEKGSGKTYLLRDYIFPHFYDNGDKVFLHEGKDYNEKYEDIITKFQDSIEKNERIMREIGRNFEYLTRYTESNPSNFIEEFKRYYNNKSANKSAKIIKKNESKFSGDTSRSYHSIFSETEENILKINEVQKINEFVREPGNQNSEALNAQLELLRQDLVDYMIGKLKQLYINNNVGSFLTALKGSVHKKTGKESKPNNIGFASLVSARLNATKANSLLREKFQEIKRVKTHSLGVLPNKGEVFLETSIEVLSSDEKYSKESIFKKRKIVTNREIMTKITNFKIEDFKKINDYFSQGEMISAEEFCEEVIKKRSVVKIDGNDNYDPSEGEKAIITISGLLEDDSYDCYLFDEIERGLGQKYITEFIVPKLKEQRDKGKTIVLSTHNSNIAINTLPSQTIYCDYKANETDVYFLGNLYSNKLIGIESGMEIDWMDKALVHLEGSKEMFGIRRNIYGI